MESIDHSQVQEFLHMRKADLNEDEVKALLDHLAGCAECRGYAASLDNLQKSLKSAFHTRWDAVQPSKSRTAGVLIRWGRDTMKARLLRYAGTAVGVLALIGLIVGLDFIIRNLRPQPATVPITPTGTSIPLPIISPPTPIPTASNTLFPSATPLPEGTIVLDLEYAIAPPNPDSHAIVDQLAHDLSAASGLNVVAVPGPTTNMEILEAMRDGKIQMAELDSLTYIYGQSQGWVAPGPVVNYPHTPSGSIMFVARTDSGLVKGEPPQVFQQLDGKRPCWPDINQGWHMSRPPIYEYVLPKGLLAEAGVVLGEPVYVTYTESHRDNATEVFLKQCDFAVVQAIPEEYYLMQWAPYLGSLGYTIDDWATQMQVLYTTPELEPYRIMAFSSQLDAAKREPLTNAILQNPQRDEYSNWQPYDNGQAELFNRFQQLVAASGVDVSEYLNRVWDEYLLSLVTAAQTPSPTLEPTKPPSTRTLTICMGAEPDSLDFYQSSSLADSNVMEAIYDGPIDSNGFSYQPVILEKLPSLPDGDASIKPVPVKENDTIVNDKDEVVQLQPGTVVRPYGCNLSTCAITWQGGPLEMAQMSATFTLKQGIRWSDGEPLTADDSVFGFEIASGCLSQFEPNVSCGTLGASGRSAFARTASYTALDEYTAQWVGLPGFLDQTYMTNFAHPLPRHLMKTNTPQQFQALLERSPLGWGAYKIDHWKPGEYIQLSKNLYYFRLDEGLPHFDQLTIRFLSLNEDGMITAIENGTCDVVDQEAGQVFFRDTASLGRLLELNASGLIKGLISTGTTWEHLDFNIQPVESIVNNGSFAGWDLDGDGQGPFGEVRLRQAVAMCVDRQKVVEATLLGQSAVPITYLPPNHPLLNTQVANWSYDPAAAGSLLDEIGWKDTDNDPATPRVAVDVTGVPDGTLLEMNYETTDAAIRQQITQIIAQSLADCGIKVNITLHSASDWFAAGPNGPLYGRKYDLGEFAWMVGAIPPCDLFLGSTIPSTTDNWVGQNTTGFSDQAYDAACNLQMQSLPGQEAFTEGVMEAQRIFAEQLPVIPLFMRLKYAASRPDMCGYSLDPTSNSDFWNIEAFDYGPGCK